MYKIIFRLFLLCCLLLNSKHYAEEQLAEERYIDFEPYFGENIVTAIKRIDLDDFPGATNPSIIKTDEGYILIFRYLPDPYYDATISYIGLVLLDDSFERISEPQLLNTRNKKSKTPSQSEDARLFSYRGKIFLIYNDNVDIIVPGLGDRRDMFMAELFRTNDHYTLSTPLKLFCDEKKYVRIWEKNWVPFEWNKMLLLGYTISPHEIIYPNLTNGECYPCYETWELLDWDFGTLRGSSPGILVDGEYLAFFHSGIKLASEASWGHDLWHYFMGAYTFSAEPPFAIKKMSTKPIIAKGFYTESYCSKRVIFPGGFVVSGSSIYVAYGKDDQEVWIATLDKKALMRSLSPVEKKK